MNPACRVRSRRRKWYVSDLRIIPRVSGARTWVTFEGANNTLSLTGDSNGLVVDKVDLHMPTGRYRRLGSVATWRATRQAGGVVCLLDGNCDGIRHGLRSIPLV